LERPVSEGTTAAEIHIVVGDILEKMTLQNGQSEVVTAEPSRAAISNENALPGLPR
jgi:hypothetical protein